MWQARASWPRRNALPAAAPRSTAQAHGVLALNGAGAQLTVVGAPIAAVAALLALASQCGCGGGGGGGGKAAKRHGGKAARQGGPGRARGRAGRAAGRAGSGAGRAGRGLRRSQGRARRPPRQPGGPCRRRRRRRCFCLALRRFAGLAPLLDTFSFDGKKKEAHIGLGATTVTYRMRHKHHGQLRAVKMVGLDDSTTRAPWASTWQRSSRRCAAR